jgi:hypothetical protein
MTSSLDEKPGPSIWTVIPKLVLRTGLSALRPLTGLRKHHAGTAPSSTLLSLEGDENKDLAVEAKNAILSPNDAPSIVE